MSFTWRYPIYLIPHGGGFASIVDPAAADDPAHLLIVHTGSETAQSQMQEFEIIGEPRPMNNDREFSWLLQSLRNPVTEVVFDPVTEGKAIDQRWRVTVSELIERHLNADLSPWNYPVFVIAQDAGFVSIVGQEETAIGIFTSKDTANDYLREANEEGELCELVNVDSTRIFFESISGDVLAAALDPVVVDDRRTAKYCFAIEILLKKYLVREKPENDSESTPNTRKLS